MTPSPAGRRGPGGAQRAGRAPHETDSDFARAVARLPEADLPELFRFWGGSRAPSVPDDRDALRAQVLEWAADPDVVAARVETLGKRLSAIFDAHLFAPRHERAVADLIDDRQLAYLSSYDVEAALATLVRRALLVPVDSKIANRYGVRAHLVPRELAEAVLRHRRRRRRGVFDALTLKGHLERLGQSNGRPPARVREMYKMYRKEAAAVARVDRLPEGLRALVEKTILQFGGLLPRSLFERMETELPHWNGRRWAKLLEESLVGTVERLDLLRFGLNHNDETLIVFNEVALAWLKRVAVPGDPDQPHHEASLGVDLVSNISRFLGFLLDHNVRFTVKGEIFKSTEKRIAEELIPNPGRELDRLEVLKFIFRFARHAHLIDSTGERTFTVTSRGKEWEPQSLEEKLRALLDYTIEERGLGGEYYHQARMRRIYLRILKRVEPEVWYDLMYVPFLARNTYLANLNDLAVEDYFTARAAAGDDGTPMEDLQRLAWNLVGWVRKRLFLLGLVDLGYDSAQRPVAMRLTRIGARLIGGVEREEQGHPGVGNLVVTPDFEVVLFPTGDDAVLVHDLDRFCRREKLGHLIHFRISEKGVVRALQEGMSLGGILATLEGNSRTPVPQNVLYSIRSWAAHAGLLWLNGDRVVSGENVEVMRRFVQDPGVRPYISRVLDAHHVQLKRNHTPKRLRSVLRELDYLVEHEP